MNKLVRMGWLALFLALAGCGGGGGGGGGGDGSISTGDVNALMENVAIKVGANTAVLRAGALPTPSANPAAPKAEAGIAAVTAEPGDTVTVPVLVQASGVLRELCAKIGSASSVLCANLNAQPRAAVKSTVARKALESSTTLNFELTVPDEVEPDGQFCVDLNVSDTDSLVSNTEQICVNVVAQIQPAANDQPSAAALPAALAGSWVGGCQILVGLSGSGRLGFQFGGTSPNSYAEFVDIFFDSNDCSGTPERSDAASGVFVAGTAAFNPQLRLFQIPFDFDPISSEFDTCFNVIRVVDVGGDAADRLFLGIPTGFTTSSTPDEPGSCTTPANRPASVALALPFVRDTTTPAPGNQSPVADAGADRTVAIGNSVSLAGSGNDTDGSVVSHSWQQISGSPTVSLQNANMATASFVAPSVTQTTALTFRLTVTDDGGATGTDTVVITVAGPAPNQLPTANAGDDREVAAGTNVSLSGSGSDPDGTIASFDWLQTVGSPIALVNGNTANASFTAPNVSQRTEFAFRLTVTDDRGGTANDTVVIAVTPATVAVTVDAGGDRTIVENQTVTLQGSATPQGTAIRWTQVGFGGLPAVVLQNPQTLNASFTAPNVDRVVVLRFRIEATANPAVFDEVDITVDPIATGTGTLSFRLDWNTATDQDLHVREPSGTVIFFSNRGVVSPNGGVLDVDDIDGFGPENIFYAAEPPDGNYCFGARYFSGTGATSVNLQVRRNGILAHSTPTLSLAAAGQTQAFLATKSAGTLTFRGVTANELATTCPGLFPSASGVQ